MQDISSLNMKVRSIPVITAISRHLKTLISKDIFSPNTSLSNIFVISVIIKLHEKTIFRLTLMLSIKASGILAINVNTKQ